jgi:hypothetical protein
MNSFETMRMLAFRKNMGIEHGSLAMSAYFADNHLNFLFVKMILKPSIK